MKATQILIDNINDLRKIEPAKGIVAIDTSTGKIWVADGTKFLNNVAPLFVGTLTSAQNGGGTLVGYQSGLYGSLSPDNFELNGTTYTVSPMYTFLNGSDFMYIAFSDNLVEGDSYILDVDGISQEVTVQPGQLNNLSFNNQAFTDYIRANEGVPITFSISEA